MSTRFAPAWLGALLTLVLASSASAAPSDGAQVTKTRQCDVIESGTVCIDDHVVSNFVSTPSGTTVIVGNTRYRVTFTSSSGACSFAQSGREQFRAVFGPRTSVSSGRSLQVFRFQASCNSGPISVCESVMQFHQVNGVLQFQRARSECTEEPAP